MQQTLICLFKQKKLFDRFRLNFILFLYGATPMSLDKRILLALQIKQIPVNKLGAVLACHPLKIRSTQFS